MVVGIAVIADVEAFVEVEVLPIEAAIIELTTAIDQKKSIGAVNANIIDRIIANTRVTRVSWLSSSSIARLVGQEVVREG